MFIGLKIENVDKLPDGGPLGYRSRSRGFELGRENRDFNLPDPDLLISGLHCEVRFEANAFWLHDVSRNGTFVNGSSQRVTGPHLLCSGDRLRIGRYIISVSIEDERRDQASPSTADKWGGRPSSPTVSGPRPEGPQPSRMADSVVSGATHRMAPIVAGHPAPPQRQADRSLSFEGDPFLAAAGSPLQSQRQQAAPVQAAPSRASPAPSALPGVGLDAAELLRSIAAGAGVSPEVFLQRDARDVAVEIGAVLRTVVDELALLLKARAAAKVMARSGHRTMIGSADNNPLKFVPGSEEILEKMFARRNPGYLDAKQSVEEAFRDLKTHEIATYAAMQAALARLLDDLSPDTIEKKLVSSSFASKKGRAWDAFVATWEAKEDAHENGMLDAFLTYFSESYAKAAKQK